MEIPSLIVKKQTKPRMTVREIVADRVFDFIANELYGYGVSLEEFILALQEVIIRLHIKSLSRIGYEIVKVERELQMPRMQQIDKGSQGFRSV